MADVLQKNRLIFALFVLIALGILLAYLGIQMLMHHMDQPAEGRVPLLPAVAYLLLVEAGVVLSGGRGDGIVMGIVSLDYDPSRDSPPSCST